MLLVGVLVANRPAHDWRRSLWVRRQARPAGSATGTCRRIRYSKIAYTSCAECISIISCNSGSVLRPCLIRTYLHKYLGAREVCKITCTLFCCCFRRYGGLGKVKGTYRGVLRGDTKTRTTCTLNVQQNSSIAHDTCMSQ